jgi:hypothetical protein
MGDPTRKIDMPSKTGKSTKFAVAGLVFAITASAGIGFLQDARSAGTADTPWPLQVEMRVPFEPTAFSSAGRTHLTYELHLTNFGNAPLTLRRIEMLDASGEAAEPVAAFEGAPLDALLQPVGAQADESGKSGQLAAGGSVVAFMWVAVVHGARLPNTLRHRVRTADSAVEGAIIGTHHTELKVLRSPVQGTNWLASDAPSNDADNHHRRGIFVIDGHAVISRRYAIDWMQVDNGSSFSGDSLDKRSYYAYGRPVVAVADATVVTVKDGLPDNVPGHNTPGHQGFNPAVPLTMDTHAGNIIILDLGNGQFANYFHLEAASLRVKVGEHVKRGQILALIGNSGDAREPHLHFEITTSPKLMAGEGLPYLIDHYRAKTGDAWQTRTHELPLKDMVIDFGQSR